MIESCKNKDKKGENIYHEVFKLPGDLKIKFLKILMDKDNKLKINLGLLKQSGDINKNENSKK